MCPDVTRARMQEVSILLRLKEVLEPPASTSGRVVAPALTALGGFGFQKAAFAFDKTRIYSDTALGRTTYYALERIGRIGVLWHRAKHVVSRTGRAASNTRWPRPGGGCPSSRELGSRSRSRPCSTSSAGGSPRSAGHVRDRGAHRCRDLHLHGRACRARHNDLDRLGARSSSWCPPAGHSGIRCPDPGQEHGTASAR